MARRRSKRQRFGPGVKRGQKRDAFGRFEKRGEFPPRPAPRRIPKGFGPLSGQFRTRERTKEFDGRNPLAGLRGETREIIALGKNGVLGRKTYTDLAKELGCSERQAFTLWYSP